MDFQVDLRAAELLASRLCHDLVGPIGAVNNGMELLGDGEMELTDEALSLTTESAQQAAVLLQFYRMAYGMAGNRQGGDLKPIRELAQNYFAHEKAELDWPAELAPDDLPVSTGKLILNMLLLAHEALPRGGTLGVRLSEEGGAREVAVLAVGADVGLREEAQAGLAEEVSLEDLTPRGVQGYFTRLLARRLGSDLEVEAAGQGHLRLGVRIPG